MDGQTRFLLIAELKRELHADECTDERGLEILAEIRQIERGTKTSPPKRNKTKQVTERYMTVLGGYVLDMHDHGKLVGTRTESGGIVSRAGRPISREVAPPSTS